jgi:hypothetical protein
VFSTDHLLIFAVGLVAGAINSVAGGGTLLTFPLLLWLGRDPVIANATNALALWPGSLAGAVALRREVFAMRLLLRWLLPIGVVGSLIGGVLLLATPSRVFGSIVPYLVLFATLLLAVQRPLTQAFGTADAPSAQRKLVLMLAQLGVSIYGGYFGAAAGILMLAAYAVFGIQDIHRRNAVKNTLATVNNGVAGIYFVCMGAIEWSDALVLGVSAILGGYIGGRVSLTLSRRTVEIFVIAIGIAATLTLALR